MPFVPKYLKPEECEAVYRDRLRRVEHAELNKYLDRLIDPVGAPDLAEVTAARETLERDLAASRECWKAED